jgi:hypothetical protein
MRAISLPGSRDIGTRSSPTSPALSVISEVTGAAPHPADVVGGDHVANDVTPTIVSVHLIHPTEDL